MWHPRFAALDAVSARHRQHAEPSWQQQQQQQQQQHVGGAARASQVVVPLSAFGGAGLQQPVQVVMPGGQLGLLLPLLSPQPGAPLAATRATAWRPQQQAGAQHGGISVNPPSVPPPCPPPRPPALSAMRLPLKRHFHGAGIIPRTQGDLAMPSNHLAAERLRKRLREGAAKAGSGAAVKPAPRPSAAVQPLPTTSLPGASLQQAAICRQQTSDVPECIRCLQQEGDDSELLFLGTGAAEPSKYRGASSIHLRRARPAHAAAAILDLAPATGTTQAAAASLSACLRIILRNQRDNDARKACA